MFFAARCSLVHSTVQASKPPSHPSIRCDPFPFLSLSRLQLVWGDPPDASNERRKIRLRWRRRTRRRRRRCCWTRSTTLLQSNQIENILHGPRHRIRIEKCSSSQKTRLFAALASATKHWLAGWLATLRRRFQHSIHQAAEKGSYRDLQWCNEGLSSREQIEIVVCSSIWFRSATVWLFCCLFLLLQSGKTSKLPPSLHYTLNCAFSRLALLLRMCESLKTKEQQRMNRRHESKCKES